MLRWKRGHCRTRGRQEKRTRGRHEMKRQALFFSIFAAAMFTLPAFAADDTSGITGVRWGKNAFNFEPIPSGPQPLINTSRHADATCNAVQLYGDYYNHYPSPKSHAVC